ncbi:MAG: hypothetical protein QOD98_3763 [Nocardioidaceae bacterium]|nr:hypothetical protein [Nocardioidaceae bacterium]
MSFVTQQPPGDQSDEPVPSPEEIAEELDAAAEEHDALDEERRYPSTLGGAFYLLVLAMGAVGIAIVWGGDWRLGIRCLAGGLCFAALLRLVLPARDAGMLAVRNRFFDAILLGGVGAAILFLSTTIPNQPG